MMLTTMANYQYWEQKRVLGEEE